VPQVLAVASAHCCNGSAPAGTLVQTPALPLSAHDLQSPAQAVMQQVPCAQTPELHSPSVEHPAPIGFLPQLPFMQVFPAVQSALVVQLCLHCPFAPHTNGAHEMAGVLAQVPLPSQRPAKVSDEPVHPAL
jgi:hypothetical protein